MTIDSMVMAFAGGMVLIGLLLSLLFSSVWLILPAFVGANMIQAAFTGFCPAAILLKRLGVQPGAAFFKN